jgi:NDP-hexose C3-ketoreductase / dTDP-4-oxo-2-deoxy-alpha-D-pentos-2-ene 2,3-reductase
MKYTNLGRTGLTVSKLCLGTMNFGVHTSESDSFEIMDCALDLGVNFFDTANVYGGSISEGITEKIIGNWLAQGKRRDNIVLATKVFGKMGEGVNDKGLSAYHIRKACEDSLQRLKTDHIDLYQMHHIDRKTPWEEIWQAMEQLVKDGKVLYIGSSNFAAIHIVQAQYEAKLRNFMGLISEQSLYNLNVRSVELELIPACKEYGLGLIPWSPLASGLLGGILKKSQKVRRNETAIQQVLKKYRNQIEQFEILCEKLGEKPANVSLAWLLKNPIVTAPIIGPRTIKQFESSIRSLDIELNDETLLKLDEIWPGPGGQAPEAYAW